MQRMRDSLIERVIVKMEQDESIFFLTADFGSPKLDVLRAKFPNRFLNVGIAEQNLINLATGLALEGFTVFAYAIAPFITMRCYEQIRVNLAILSSVRRLNVNLIGVGAGFSYDMSGPTHQALEDVSIMRALPNLLVASPSDALVSAGIVDLCLERDVPKYIRLDGKPVPPVYESNKVPDCLYKDGFAMIRRGECVCVVSHGYMTNKAMAAAEILEKEGINIGILDVLLLKGLNEKALIENLSAYSRVVSIEEAFLSKGGVDSMLLHLFRKFDLKVVFDAIGVEDSYKFHVGDREQRLADAGLSEFKIADRLREQI